MRTITQRELRNSSAAVMDEVERGEEFTITRNGTPVAKLVPIRGSRTFVPLQELAAASVGLPHIDYQQLRSEADEFFQDGGDRVQ